LTSGRAADHHQRAEHRRQDRGAEDHGAAGHDGAGGIAGAGCGGEFPVFTAFLADIGDAQSIEAALSTFSAHITNLDRLSRLADAQIRWCCWMSLGSSTDPEEGSALAVAVAAHFLEAGAWTLISTHHTSLKVYAANTAGRAQCGGGRGRE
jgi:DNA mismatch repair protein MutS2